MTSRANRESKDTTNGVVLSCFRVDKTSIFFFENRFSFDVAGETGSFAKTSSVIITVQITLLSEQDGALEECLCQAGMLVCPELAAFLRA